MSAIQMIIANIEKLNDTDRAQVLGHFSKSAPAKEVGVSKDVEKKKNANKGKPTCYADFSKKIVEEHKGAVAAFKLANPDLKGAHLSFVGLYKKDHPEEFTAYEVAWKLAHPKVEAPKNEAEAPKDEVEPATDAKPKRVMTEEQKAKMKAGREAAKAKKEAAAPRVVAVSMMAELMGHGEVPDEIAALAVPTVTPDQKLKKRGPKKLEDMTAEERAKHDARKIERQAKKAADKAAGRPTVYTDTGSDTSVPRSASPKQKAE